MRLCARRCPLFPNSASDWAIYSPINTRRVSATSPESEALAWVAHHAFQGARSTAKNRTTSTATTRRRMPLSRVVGKEGRKEVITRHGPAPERRFPGSIPVYTHWGGDNKDNLCAWWRSIGTEVWHLGQTYELTSTLCWPVCFMQLLAVPHTDMWQLSHPNEGLTISCPAAHQPFSISKILSNVSSTSSKRFQSTGNTSHAVGCIRSHQAFLQRQPLLADILEDLAYGPADDLRHPIPTTRNTSRVDIACGPGTLALPYLGPVLRARIPSPILTYSNTCHTSVTPIGLRAHFQPTLVSPLRLLFKQWVLTQ
ncbi:hypothetical protein C8F01DRAFT_1091293 [Mycena amicta]|nr:hypothetical protein C8F01DRAFT_1091293 [Mycena amicta]